MKCWLMLWVTISCAMGAVTSVTEGGKALVPIVVSEAVSEPVRQAATDLAGVLGRMSGANFSVEVGGDPRGIVVGTVTQFPGVPGAGKLSATDVMRREEYVIHSDGQRVWLVGASDAGASHAVWDFLYRLGYRQYFPGPNWEIIPKQERIVADIDLFASPDYKMRRFAWHYGNWSDVVGVSEWLTRNRIVAGKTFLDVFVLNTAHAYANIIKGGDNRKKGIQADPSIRSLVNGKPTLKLNPANPRTLEAVKAYASAFFEKNPDATSLSMDPSDGGGWGTSPEELAIGTPSDRALYLANLVAEFINQPGEHGVRYVGMYAYNEHSPPPTRVTVDPRVIISFATSFIKQGFTVQELMQGWGRMGAKLLGIREYHSVVAWDGSAPTKGRAANLDYLARTIPEFHRLGASFYTTEAGQNWGSQGLGNYFTTRLLWDVEEAKQKDVLIQEFVSNCFPEAAQLMLRFYQEYLHPKKSVTLTRDLLGRMYRTLDEARHQTREAGALRRLDDLITYTRFAELLYAYQRSAGKPIEERASALEDVTKFSYRIRKTGMMSSYAFFRDIPTRNKAVPRPEGTNHLVVEGNNPWKDTTPVTPEDLNTWVSEGINNNPVVDVETASFSRELVRASQLPAAAAFDSRNEAPKFIYPLRHKQQLLIWSDVPESPIEFTVKTGVFYTNLGNLTLSLYPYEAEGAPTEAGENPAEEGDIPVFLHPLDTVSLPADKEEHSVKMKSGQPGPYLLEIKDQAAGYHLTNWSKDIPLTFESSMERSPVILGGWQFVFYVPKGTQKVNLFVKGRGTIQDQEGGVLEGLPQEPTYLSIPVPPGQDGTFWKFTGKTGGTIQLLNVPPYLASSASQLLLPREVVEADAPKGKPVP